MKLYSFKIEGFRRILSTEIKFGDATFLIGENNVGKSTVLKALDLFFSNNKPNREDFLIKNHIEEIHVEKIVLTATFTKVPREAKDWPGFKGRILSIKDSNGQLANAITYRKTYTLNGNVKYEMREYNRELKQTYKEAKTLQDLINNGVSEDDLQEVVPDFTPGRRLTTSNVANGLRELDELWDMNHDEERWFENPGGIPGNILVKLPRYLLIPAEDKQGEISQRSGALHKTMNELFETVRDQSENYEKAQEYLNLLAKELDPSDPKREFGKMMTEVNSILKNVFPESRLHVETNLRDPNDSIVPSFEIGMSSNVKTSTERQGMGTIRSAVFALLRYREALLAKKASRDKKYICPLIIGFEEPEIYLHPNAANNMRDEIYNLATSSTSQIIATTHSPYLIDLGKDIENDEYPKQVLNLVTLDYAPSPYTVTTTVSSSKALNVTDAYLKLKSKERDSLKLLLKIDDHVARVFFTKNVIIIEGDTEEIVLRETIRRMPNSVKRQVLSNYQIIRARGKAAIIALVKYLRALSLDPFVIHDKDVKSGATKYNNPIKEALSSPSRRYVCENCIEDELGYGSPSRDKPFHAHNYIQKNWLLKDGWLGVQEGWRRICEEELFKEIFKPYLLNKIVTSIIISKNGQ